MLAKLGNSEPALLAALQNGDIYCIRDKGKDYYAWRTLEVERSHGCRQNTSVTAPSKELQNEKQQEAMSGFFDTFQSTLGFPASSSAGLPALTTETSKKGQAGAFQLSIPFHIISNIQFLVCFNFSFKYYYAIFDSLVLCQKDKTLGDTGDLLMVQDL